MTRVEASPTPHITATALFPVAVLALVWGCNWPVLKMGVTEIAPLTFRALTLPFAGLGWLAVAAMAGASLRIPRPLWVKVALLALVAVHVVAALWHQFWLKDGLMLRMKRPLD